jgi:hypothetical protein
MSARSEKGSWFGMSCVKTGYWVLENDGYETNVSDDVDVTRLTN